MDRFRYLTLISIFMFFFALQTSLTDAVGITTPFFDDRVEMYTNDRMVITFLLQNMIGGEDLDATVEILEGSEIARIVDGPTIHIPYGRKDIPLNVELTTPANPLPSYIVDFMVKTVVPKERRQIQISTGLEKRFTVIVKDGVRPVAAPVQTAPVPQPVVEQSAALKAPRQKSLLAAALIILIFILYRLVKKHKQKYEAGRNRSRYSL